MVLSTNYIHTPECKPSLVEQPHRSHNKKHRLQRGYTRSPFAKWLAGVSLEIQHCNFRPIQTRGGSRGQKRCRSRVTSVHLIQPLSFLDRICQYAVNAMGSYIEVRSPTSEEYLHGLLTSLRAVNRVDSLPPVSSQLSISAMPSPVHL
jgi:hypothetical protein